MKRFILMMLCLSIVLLFSAAQAEAYVKATGSVNVRTGPGLGFETLGSVSAGTALNYAGSSSVDDRGVEWYSVEYNGSTAWMSSVYSVLVNAADSTPEPTVVTYVQATASVNVREEPGLHAEDIGTLEENEMVEYANDSRYDSQGVLWYYVRYYNHGYGWVSSTYARLVTAAPGQAGVQTYSSVNGSYVYAEKGDSNLRSGPGLDYAQLCTMKKGESAVYLDNYSVDSRGVMWYYVSFDGQIGWISSRYAKLK